MYIYTYIHMCHTWDADERGKERQKKEKRQKKNLYTYTCINVCTRTYIHMSHTWYANERETGKGGEKKDQKGVRQKKIVKRREKGRGKRGRERECTRECVCVRERGGEREWACLRSRENVTGILRDMLQCVAVAVCCSVLQLQYVAVCCSRECYRHTESYVEGCCSCSMLQLQYVAVAVCCSVLQ